MTEIFLKCLKDHQGKQHSKWYHICKNGYDQVETRYGPLDTTGNIHVTLLFQLVIFTGLVRVGVKIPQDGNRANWYGHVAVVREHV